MIMQPYTYLQPLYGEGLNIARLHAGNTYAEIHKTLQRLDSRS